MFQKQSKSSQNKEGVNFLKNLGQQVRAREKDLTSFWEKVLPIYQKASSNCETTILDVAVKIMNTTKDGDQAVRDCAALILGVDKVDNALYRAAVSLLSSTMSHTTVKGDCLTMWANDTNDLKYKFMTDIAVVLLEQAVTQKAESYLLCALTLAEINFQTFKDMQKIVKLDSSTQHNVTLSMLKGQVVSYACISYMDCDDKGEGLSKEFLIRLNTLMKEVVESYTDEEKYIVTNLNHNDPLPQIKTGVLVLMMLSRVYAKEHNYSKALICLQKALDFTLILENQKIILPNSEVKNRIVRFCAQMVDFVGKKYKAKKNDEANTINKLLEEFVKLIVDNNQAPKTQTL